MGEKGSKATTTGQQAAEELAVLLAPLGSVTHKKMFGGYGFFHQEAMFCVVDPKGVAYLKADGDLLARMEKAGAKKHGRMPYYSIPAKVMGDPKALLAWAKQAVSA